MQEAQFPTTFSSELLRVERDDVAPKMSMPIMRLQHKGYDIAYGLRQNDVPALTDIAQQAATREYCSNDLDQRWGNTTMARRQLAKDGGRAVMQLLSREDESLIGFAWIGAISPATSDHLPKCRNTCAIRLHEAAQGKGLAVDFTQAVLAISMRHARARQIGLETWGSNRAAVRTYLKAGAELVDTEHAARPTLSTKRGVGVFRINGQPHVGDTRLFMQFPQTM